MTIALGILSNDGIVIAADTEVSAGYLKGTQGKLVSFQSMQAGNPQAGSLAGACVISGAGDAGYVRALTTEMGSVFLDHPSLATLAYKGNESLQDKFKVCIKQFYKEHVIPFASFPTRDRPDVEILMGIYRQFNLKLLVTEKTTVRSEMPYRSIGIGSTFVDLLLSKLYRPCSVKYAEILAAYLIFMAKDSVEGCGKYTMITTIHGARMGGTPVGSQLIPPQPGITHVDWNTIDQWERQFKTVWARTEGDTIWSLIEKQSIVDRSNEKSKKSRKS